MFDTKEENCKPFWGYRPTTAGGRDPLAIQNSSVVIYSTMIPGITNLTNRVRYMGFYCWLLNELLRIQDAKKTKTVSLKEQIEYIRRSELLLAYVMVHLYNNVTGVGGSNYASKHLHDNSDGVNLIAGQKKYWKNSLGVFGQYYIGVMFRLGLISPPDDEHSLYRVTSIGDELDNKFKENISEELSSLFIRSIYKGYCSFENLDRLGVFALHNIPVSQELNQYRQILTGSDANFVSMKTYNRLATFKLILNYIDKNNVYNNNSVLPFLQNNFLNVINNNLDVSNERLFWFIYELNELVHSAFEAFHYGLLYKTSDDPLPFEYVIQSIETDVNEWCQENNVRLINDLNLKCNIYDVYHQMIKCRNSSYKMCIAMHLLYILDKIISPYYQKLSDMMIADETLSHFGYSPIMLSTLITKDKDTGIETFIYNSIIRAINIHTKSSFEKSSIDKGLVNNYLIDSGYIWQLRRTESIRTTPRIKNAIQYMIDIHWLSTKDNMLLLTVDGKKMINGYDA